LGDYLNSIYIYLNFSFSESKKENIVLTIDSASAELSSLLLEHFDAIISDLTDFQ